MEGAASGSLAGGLGALAFPLGVELDRAGRKDEAEDDRPKCGRLGFRAVVAAGGRRLLWSVTPVSASKV